MASLRVRTEIDRALERKQLGIRQEDRGVIRDRAAGVFAVISLMLQTPVSLFVFPIPTVAHKLETDSGIRIGLPAVKATV
jgi:hypothetical protein